MNNTQKNSMISGYAGLPFGEFSQCAAGSVAVLGVPSDVDSGPRHGASMAPDALRKMTQQLGIKLPADGCDLGNWSVTGDASTDWPNALTGFIAQMIDQQITPIVLGGASDVATAVLQAFPNLAVVAATPIVQSNVAARPENTTWLGLNGGQPSDVWNEITQRKMTWHTARQLDEVMDESQDEKDAKIFPTPNQAILWIDLSVIDLGQAAGAIGLNPAGMKPETLVSVIDAMTCHWKAIVVTGLAPANDSRGLSELAAIESLNAALRTAQQ